MRGKRNQGKIVKIVNVSDAAPYNQFSLAPIAAPDIRYVETTPEAISLDLGRGRVDFAANLVPSHIAAIDAGAAITIVGGVHAGCYELFAREGIRSIGDLKGKSVGLYGGPDLISAIAAYVGLDPKKDLALVNDPALKPLELFAVGKLDAYLGVPPEPQILHAARWAM